jgi:hypothetical protein
MTDAFVHMACEKHGRKNDADSDDFSHAKPWFALQKMPDKEIS